MTHFFQTMDSVYVVFVIVILSFRTTRFVVGQCLYLLQHLLNTRYTAKCFKRTKTCPGLCPASLIEPWEVPVWEAGVPPSCLYLWISYSWCMEDESPDKILTMPVETAAIHKKSSKHANLCLHYLFLNYCGPFCTSSSLSSYLPFNIRKSC